MQQEHAISYNLTLFFTLSPHSQQYKQSMKQMWYEN